MTDNYIGKHGEFNEADEDLDILEDMYAMHHNNPDADLTTHYGWENKLNYDSEGIDEFGDNW